MGKPFISLRKFRIPTWKARLAMSLRGLNQLAIGLA